MKMFYKLVFGALLAMTLVFAGCKEGGANISAVEAPKVTAAAIPTGVKLEWNAVIGASDYTVYRREAGGADIALASTGSSGIIGPVEGKYVFRDTQSGSLTSVKAKTKYTYTVEASPQGDFKDSGKKKVSVKTGATFLAEGTQLNAPSAVAIELQPEFNQIKVTVTPDKAHQDMVTGYQGVLLRDDNQIGGGFTISYPRTTGVVTSWTTQDDGAYTVKVIATPASARYLSSTIKKSEPVSFASLFNSNSSINVSLDNVILGGGASANNVVNYSAEITLSNLKAGVVYGVQRAPTDEAGAATGDYADVALSKYSGSAYVAADASDLTANHLGNLGVSNLYDRGVPAGTGYYKYRIKAQKGDAEPQYSAIAIAIGSIAVDPKDAISTPIISIDFRDPANASGATTYAVARASPRVYGNLLDANDKLVIYWAKSGGGNYLTAKYTGTIEFSKADLEAATAPAKSIVVQPAGDGSSYIYVYGQLEFADGAKKNVSINGGIQVGAQDSITYYRLAY